VLKDGTEIHRIDPPPEVYDYTTGKLIGHLAPRCHSRQAKKEDEVLIVD